MANVVWPDSLCPRTFSLRLIADTRSSGSVYGGSEIVNDLEDDTWAVTMEIDSRSGETGDALGALVNYLQGGIHTAEFGHFARPQSSRSAGLRRASSATYLDGGILKYAEINEARYPDGELLLETAATNLLPWSENFGDTLWLKSSAPAGNGSITIDDFDVTFDDLNLIFENTI